MSLPVSQCLICHLSTAASPLATLSCNFNNTTSCHPDVCLFLAGRPQLTFKFTSCSMVGRLVLRILLVTEQSDGKGLGASSVLNYTSFPKSTRFTFCDSFKYWRILMFFFLKTPVRDVEIWNYINKLNETGDKSLLTWMIKAIPRKIQDRLVMSLL